MTASVPKVELQKEEEDKEGEKKVEEEDYDWSNWENLAEIWLLLDGFSAEDGLTVFCTRILLQDHEELNKGVKGERDERYLVPTDEEEITEQRKEKKKKKKNKKVGEKKDIFEYVKVRLEACMYRKQESRQNQLGSWKEKVTFKGS